MRTFITGLLILLFLAGPAIGENKAAKEQAGPFQVGEQLVFDVCYGVLKVGTATMTIEEIVEINGRKAYHIVLINKTSEAYSRIFKVEDRFESFLDVEKLVPLKYIKKLAEGDHTSNKITLFDHENLMADYTSLKKNKKKKFPIKSGTQDALSIFYKLRKENIEIGKKLHFTIVADAKVYDLEIKPLKKVRKSIYGGSTFDTIQMVPKASHGGDLFSKGKGWLWISDNDMQVPVAFRAKLPFGSITFALVKIHNIYDSDGSFSKPDNKI
jgi:Protein of unknown function (DUF3108)